MSKKNKPRKIQGESKPNFLELHWNKFVILLLFILPLIYFFPFLNPDRMIGGSDYLIGGYPFEKWTKEQSELPLWYPDVFAGIPVLGAPVGGPLAPLNLLKVVFSPQVVLALTFILFFFIAGLGTYLYLKAIGLSPYSAALGAVIYQFIGNLATTPMAGHAGRAASIAMFPLILFFVHRALQSRKMVYFILTALATGFAFYEGHFQITYYGLLFIIGYVIYYLIARRKEISRHDLVNILVYGLSTVVLICLLMAAVWLPVLGGLGTAARGIARGYEYATSWAMPPRELIDLFIPTYSGILNNYWGASPFKLHLEYLGILPLLFSIFAIVFFLKKPYVKLYLISIIVVLFIVLGGSTPVFWIFYTIIPGFRLFRAPSLAFYLISFGLVVLGSIGFDNLVIKRPTESNKRFSARNLFIVATVLIAIFMVLGIICAVGQNSIIQGMQASLGAELAPQKLANIKINFPDFLKGIWRSLLFVVLGVILVFVSLKAKVKSFVLALIPIVIVLIDQLPLMIKFLPSAPGPKAYYAADDVVRFLNRDQGVFRVFPTPWYEHATDLYLLYHNIQSAGGYIPNPIQRYQEYIGAGTSVMFNPTNLIAYPKFLDILNAKYVIAPNLPEDLSQYNLQTQNIIKEIKNYLARFNRVFTGQKYTVYLNDSVLPRVWIAADYAVHEQTDILEIMQSPNFNPKQTVILEQDPKIPHPEKMPSHAPEQAQVLQYTPNEIVCGTKTDYPGFLVLSDNWHPDWQVFVDGQPSPLYIADYTFRAVYLTAGKHEVVFEYLSPYFSLGKTVSIFAFILSIGFCLIVLLPIRPLKK